MVIQSRAFFIIRLETHPHTHVPSPALGVYEENEIGESKNPRGLAVSACVCVCVCSPASVSAGTR